MKVLQHPASTIHFPSTLQKASLFHRFFSWCKGQEKNRLLWLALIITAHGCIITPVTLGVIMLSGNNFIFWPWAIASMGISLIVNLAALPVKITIPVFAISLLIDLAIVLNCIAF